MCYRNIHWINLWTTKFLSPSSISLQNNVKFVTIFRLLFLEWNLKFKHFTITVSRVRLNDMRWEGAEFKEWTPNCKGFYIFWMSPFLVLPFPYHWSDGCHLVVVRVFFWSFVGGHFTFYLIEMLTSVHFLVEAGILAWNETHWVRSRRS